MVVVVVAAKAGAEILANEELEVAPRARAVAVAARALRHDDESLYWQAGAAAKPRCGTERGTREGHTGRKMRKKGGKPNGQAPKVGVRGEGKAQGAVIAT